jgi:hypothetical protein
VVRAFVTEDVEGHAADGLGLAVGGSDELGELAAPTEVEGLDAGHGIGSGPFRGGGIWGRPSARAIQSWWQSG